jgi:hypothetical protein
MYKRMVSVLSTCIVFAGFVMAPPVHAAALYFEKVPVQTTSEATCLNFARDTLRSQGYSNVHWNKLEAAGNKQDVYVSITCIGRGNQPAMAVAMAAASDFNAAKQLAHAAAEQVKRIVCIDTPC